MPPFAAERTNLSFRAQRGICFSSHHQVVRRAVVVREADAAETNESNDHVSFRAKRGICLSRQRQVEMEKTYFVYILASRSHRLYTGLTNNVPRRVMQHRQGRVSSFTARYRIHRLVHVETFSDVQAAIRREKQVKAWRREKRIALIQMHNPTWVDRIEEFLPPYPRQEQIPRSARNDKSRGRAAERKLGRMTRMTELS